MAGQEKPESRIEASETELASLASMFRTDGETSPAEVPGFSDLEFVGRGGMGIVYEARDASIDRIVAVKMLAPEIGEDPTARERFLREARAMRALDHPNIVRIIDLVDGDGASPCLVMEHVGGGDLGKVLRTRALDESQALAIARQVCSALEHAHAEGIVHRDIKPSNILLGADGNVKVADFGLAKAIRSEGESDFTMTLTGAALGTPAYMAPEQHAADGIVDRRADVYSVGALLYQMLTGELPIGRFEPPSKHTPALSKGLDAIVLRALDNAPEKRFQSAAELEHALGRVGETPARTRWLAAAGFAALAIAGVVFARAPEGNKPPPPAFVPPPPVATAFTNSLGMEFVPVEGTKVLFCRWETRRGDFAAFAKAAEFSTGEMFGFSEDRSVAQKGYYRQFWNAPGFPQDETHPVTGISWKGTRLFCRWLTQKEHDSATIERTKVYRLASDKEWTLALDPQGALPWGDSAAPPRVLGNFADSTAVREYPFMETIPAYDDGFAATAPVGSFPANRFGIHDLEGNVWEWVGNHIDETGHALFRGGSWTNANLDRYKQHLTYKYIPSYQVCDVGFRIVLAPASALEIMQSQMRNVPKNRTQGPRSEVEGDRE